MGFKSLFKKKKKQAILGETLINSRSSSLNHGGGGQLEQELEQVFKKFDANGDGKICAVELGSIMCSLGHPATEAELAVMIEEVDVDGDGFELNTNGVDHDEALENLKHAFEVFDIEKNGAISAEESRAVLKILGEECTLEDCKRMISGVDSDGSGIINFDEFKVMMMKGLRLDATTREIM